MYHYINNQDRRNLSSTSAKVFNSRYSVELSYIPRKWRELIVALFPKTGNIKHHKKFVCHHFYGKRWQYKESVKVNHNHIDTEVL